MTPEKWRAIKERDRDGVIDGFSGNEDRRALIAEVEALTTMLRDLLDDMAEDVSQRHHSDKYRVYQVSPVVVEGARTFLAAREKTT
ncbi:MAG: hypothetical protein KGL39_14570 [Patescibacteria group bacterium]|nr:hypothetical protein [Patescibacteria group bacterium]